MHAWQHYLLKSYKEILGIQATEKISKLYTHIKHFTAYVIIGETQKIVLNKLERNVTHLFHPHASITKLKWNKAIKMGYFHYIALVFALKENFAIYLKAHNLLINISFL